MSALAVAPAPPPLGIWRYTPPPLPRAARLRHPQAGTREPLQPAILGDLACALDPARLSVRAGIAPDPWQAELLRAPDRQILVNCARQVGKSETTATLATHTAIYGPGAIVLLLSPSLRQSGLLFQKVKRRLKDLGDDFADITTDNALSVRLGNGAEIHSLPGKGETVRGFSGVTLIIVDEAAFIADDLITAVSPMLATSGGRLILLSTPFGKRGVFYEEWAQAERTERTGGVPAYARFAVRAEECPRIPAAFLAEERRKLGVLYMQEYGCQFLDVVTALFRTEDVAAALDNDLEPYFQEDVA